MGPQFIQQGVDYCSLALPFLKGNETEQPITNTNLQCTKGCYIHKNIEAKLNHIGMYRFGGRV